MQCVFSNLQKDDYEILSVYLFKRQLQILVKDGRAVVAVDIDTPFTLPFIANILKCKLLFSPFNFEFDGTKYHTLTIVRDSDGENNKDSRDGIFVEEACIRDLYTGMQQEVSRMPQPDYALIRERESSGYKGFLQGT